MWKRNEKSIPSGSRIKNQERVEMERFLKQKNLLIGPFDQLSNRTTQNYSELFSDLSRNTVVKCWTN